MCVLPEAGVRGLLVLVFVFAFVFPSGGRAGGGGVVRLGVAGSEGSQCRVYRFCFCKLLWFLGFWACLVRLLWVSSMAY